MGLTERVERVGPDGFTWRSPPEAPYQYLGVRVRGRPAERLRLLPGYELKLPHKRGVPTGQRFFNIGRYFDDEADLTRPASTLVRWATRLNQHSEMTISSIQVYGRVTDEAPGFGFALTPRTLAAVAAMGAWLDVSVYCFPSRDLEAAPSA